MPPTGSSSGRSNHHKSQSAFDLPGLLTTLSAVSLERQEYILNHLATHLASGDAASAKRLDVLLALRCDLGNVWYFLKASGGPASWFLRDVTLAWRRAQRRDLSHEGPPIDESVLEMQFNTGALEIPFQTKRLTDQTRGGREGMSGRGYNCRLLDLLEGPRVLFAPETQCSPSGNATLNRR